MSINLHVINPEAGIADEAFSLDVDLLRRQIAWLEAQDSCDAAGLLGLCEALLDIADPVIQS